MTFILKMFPVGSDFLVAKARTMIAMQILKNFLISKYLLETYIKSS